MVSLISLYVCRSDETQLTLEQAPCLDSVPPMKARTFTEVYKSFPDVLMVARTMSPHHMPKQNVVRIKKWYLHHLSQ